LKIGEHLANVDYGKSRPTTWPVCLAAANGWVYYATP